MKDSFELIDQLEKEHHLDREDLERLLESGKPEPDSRIRDYLAQRADRIRRKYYGNRIYIRGLIEFTNYCKNDCFYCGIRHSNTQADRYRLGKEEILECCRDGYQMGFRTFVLQGGEDPLFTPEKIADIVSAIKKIYPDCAVTLSVGEKEKEVYQMWFDAGADRYLLRHETADFGHYRLLHPAGMSAEHRQQCLWNLKEIGYQTGCGIMVGSPGQTTEHIAEDLLFMEKLQPEMVGIGPFIPQKDTPFGDQPPGTWEQTLFLLGMIRLLLPRVLLPATTALGSIHPRGRQMGICTGANVCMPNLSPAGVRKKYALYDHKASFGSESAQGLQELRRMMDEIGYCVVTDRGDFCRG